jgi:hypothetical protein
MTVPAKWQAVRDGAFGLLLAEVKLFTRWKEQNTRQSPRKNRILSCCALQKAVQSMRI